jgi:hypothetical protein
MPAEFIFIEHAALDGFLTHRGFRVIPPASGPAAAKPGAVTAKETVYGKVGRAGDVPLCIRVFTSQVDGHQRDCGADAIRVTLVTKNAEGEVKAIRGFKRVHRVKGWAENLSARIAEAESLTIKRCQCGGVMCDRTPKGSKKATFIGCSEYPRCKRTESLS